MLNLLSNAREAVPTTDTEFWLIEILFLIYVYTAVALVPALIATMIAIKRRKNAIGYFFMGFFLRFIGVLIAGLLPHDNIYQNESFSYVDELTKLKKLLDEGSITQEEYNNKKQKLMK